MDAWLARSCPRLNDLYVRKSRIYNMSYRAVIFDINGWLVTQPQAVIKKHGDGLKLPTGFLKKAFENGAPNNSFCQLERGDLLLSEFLPLFQKEVESAAKKARVTLRGFKAEDLFSSLEDVEVQNDMLQAAKMLSENGLKTCVLSNNWLNDTNSQKVSSRLSMSVRLHRFFDVVIESYKVGTRMSEPEMYQITCEKLGVKPENAIFIGDVEVNLKVASELGIKCIKVVKWSAALEKLQELTGIKLNAITTKEKNVYPPPCKPNSVPHAEAILKSGMKIHYVDVGEGPVVMLFHGFPESWYSWRYQIPALANAGYRVIAMDQRGYGESSVPEEIEEYTQEKICQDAIDFLDYLGISKAAVVGHDWGGAVVWNLALFHPNRLNGVCGITTPFLSGKGLEALQKEPETFDYQVYFQTPGTAEKELSDNIERTLKTLMRGFDDPIELPDGKKVAFDFTSVTKRGGVLVGYPEEVSRGKILSEEDLQYYVSRFHKSGLRGPLNWYRNFPANTAWNGKCPKRKIRVPALMMTASHDPILKPKYSEGMEDRIPDLSRVCLEKCSHWALIDRPNEVNDGLIKWLDAIHNIQLKS